MVANQRRLLQKAIGNEWHPVLFDCLDTDVSFSIGTREYQCVGVIINRSVSFEVVGTNQTPTDHTNELPYEYSA